MQSIFWHDYETFGADPLRDRPCQFAGVRTDLDLNIISEPITIYAKPSEDYLPSVQACLITGITPQEAMQKGMVEAEFATTINDIFSKPETCVAGYNSIRFDDEISRNLFYRNLMDPYEREWRNGNSRWDIIDVVRLTYALRPEGINWPLGSDGRTSFRLELLTQANGVSHEAAHDAMSDVYATIEMAKLVRAKQPALYDYAFNLRSKSAVKLFFDEHVDQPFLHVSSKISVEKGCIAMMYPLMPHPSNQNAIICFDLRQNPEILINNSADQLRDLLYAKSSSSEEEAALKERPALKLVHLNKCPMLAPASMIKVIPPERREEWELDLDKMRENVKAIRHFGRDLLHVREVFTRDDALTSSDPDLSIYTGGFFSPNDKTEMSKIRSLNAFDLEEFGAQFQDPRLDEMFFRYKARNYPNALSSAEREKWLSHCQSRLLSGTAEFRTFEQFASELQQAASTMESGDPKLHILEELQLYAESIYPY